MGEIEKKQKNKLFVNRNNSQRGYDFKILK